VYDKNTKDQAVELVFKPLRTASSQDDNVTQFGCSSKCHAILVGYWYITADIL